MSRRSIGAFALAIATTAGCPEPGSGGSTEYDGAPDALDALGPLVEPDALTIAETSVQPLPDTYTPPPEDTGPIQLLGLIGDVLDDDAVAFEEQTEPEYPGSSFTLSYEVTLSGGGAPEETCSASYWGGPHRLWGCYCPLERDKPSADDNPSDSICRGLFEGKRDEYDIFAKLAFDIRIPSFTGPGTYYSSWYGCYAPYLDEDFSSEGMPPGAKLVTYEDLAGVSLDGWHGEGGEPCRLKEQFENQGRVHYFVPCDRENFDHQHQGCALTVSEATPDRLSATYECFEERVYKDTTAPGITHTTRYARYFGELVLVPSLCPQS